MIAINAIQKRGGGSQLNNCFKFQRGPRYSGIFNKAYNEIIYIQVTLSSNNHFRFVQLFLNSFEKYTMKPKKVTPKQTCTHAERCIISQLTCIQKTNMFNKREEVLHHEFWHVLMEAWFECFPLQVTQVCHLSFSHP